MKKYIIIFLFLTKQLCASPDSLVVSRCYYDYDGASNGYSFTIDRYDSAGNYFSQNLVQLAIDPNQPPFSTIKQRKTNLLNQFGKAVSALTEEWNVSGWDTSGLIIYAWNLNNDTLAVKNLYWYNGTYQFSDSTYYSYNANGLIESYEGYSLNPLVLLSRKSILYDASNHVISYTTEYNSSGSGLENMTQYLYSYDASNRLTAYSFRAWDSTYWAVIDTLNYTFTPSGKIGSSLESHIDGSGADSILTFNTYDANDSLNQVDQFRYSFPANTWDSLRTVITRDPNGNVTDSLMLRAEVGVYNSYGLYHHDLSLLPDTDQAYHMMCDSVGCIDTLQLFIYTYFPGGQSYYVTQWDHGPFNYGESLITYYDSLGRLLSRENRTWGIGNTTHHIDQWHYDANGNLIYEYNLQSGSLDISDERTCFYEFYSGAGSLALNLLPDNNGSVCDSTPLPGYLLITGGTPPYYIVWNDSTEILDASSVMPVFVPVNQTSFVATVTDDLGATATDSLHLSTPSFVLDLGVDTILCQWDTLVVVAPTGFTDYNWMSGTTQSNTLQLYPLSPDTIQVYLDVMDNQGCVYSDTMNAVFEICFGVEETVFEQPVIRKENGSVILSFSERNCPERFSFNSIDGRKIISGKVDGCVLSINTSAFTPGIYLFRFTDKQNRNVSIKIPLN